MSVRSMVDLIKMDEEMDHGNGKVPDWLPVCFYDQGAG